MQAQTSQEILKTLSPELLAQFAARWELERIEVFGSVVTGTLRDDSDVDLLVTFHKGHSRTVLDHLRMERELSEWLGRPVEITSRGALDEGVYAEVRNEILSTARLLYAA